MGRERYTLWQTTRVMYVAASRGGANAGAPSQSASAGEWDGIGAAIWHCGYL